MDICDRQELDLILASEGGPHVSVYLPVPDPASQFEDDTARISALVVETRAKLTEDWMREAEADEFLKPLVQLCKDSEFLSSRSYGTAIFLSGDLFRVYRMSESIDERCVVSPTFCLRPMLSSLHIATFFLLTVTSGKACLYSATLDSILPVEDIHLPMGIEVTPQQVSAEQVSAEQVSAEQVSAEQVSAEQVSAEQVSAEQVSAEQVSAEQGGQGNSPAIASRKAGTGVANGQEENRDSQKSEIVEFLNKVDHAVTSYVHDQTAQSGQSGFLIVAGPKELTEVYQHLSSCNRLLGKTIPVNVDQLTTEQLHARVMPIAAEELRRERQADAARIREHRRNKVATAHEQVLSAACQGRIDTLFFDTGAELFGEFCPDCNSLEQLQHTPTGIPGDTCQDLIELAAVQTLRHGGHVHRVTREEMPTDSALAAALRY